MVVETGNSRTVTWRVQPPLSTRLRANAKEYLNGFTVPLSVGGDHSESGFSAARGRFCGPGSVSLGALCVTGLCGCGAASVSFAAATQVAAAKAAEPNPNTFLLLTFESALLMSAIISPVVVLSVQKI